MLSKEAAMNNVSYRKERTVYVSRDDEMVFIREKICCLGLNVF